MVVVGGGGGGVAPLGTHGQALGETSPPLGVRGCSSSSSRKGQTCAHKNWCVFKLSSSCRQKQTPGCTRLALATAVGYRHKTFWTDICVQVDFFFLPYYTTNRLPVPNDIVFEKKSARRDRSFFKQRHQPLLSALTFVFAVEQVIKGNQSLTNQSTGWGILSRPRSIATTPPPLPQNKYSCGTHDSDNPSWGHRSGGSR